MDQFRGRRRLPKQESAKSPESVPGNVPASSGESVKQEFENKINRLTKSAAYLDYCEEAYGYRLYLFNMMDRAQLDFVFHSLPLCSKDVLLDLGCGCGSILNALTKKSGCRGIGVDLLCGDAPKGENENPQYLRGDIDDIASFELHPTLTLSVDSIYFSRDPEALLRSLCRIENNRVYVFYSQYLFENEAAEKSTLHAAHTKIAVALNRLSLPYKTVDYSENERTFYEKSLCALKKREDAFKAEGNLDLFEEKMREQQLGKRLYDEGNASRYLYIIGQESTKEKHA